MEGNTFMFKKPKFDDAAAAEPGGVRLFLRRHKKALIVAVIVLAALVAVLIGQRMLARSVSADVSYVTAPVERRDITNVFNGTGTISAAHSYTVRSLVTGTILTADFEVGDEVQKGDVLYTIDDSETSSDLEKAQLSLNEAQRSYDSAQDAQYVRASCVGTVSKFLVREGDAVTAGQEVAVVQDDSVMLLTLDFPAADAEGFSVGQQAVVTVNGTFEALEGTVRSVSGADKLGTGNMLTRSVTIAVRNAGSLTTAQAAVASVNGVDSVGSAHFAYQHTQTVTAASAGKVAALCVKEGAAVDDGTALLQISSTTLTKQAASAADSLRSAELSLESAQKRANNYTVTSPISGTVVEKNAKAGDVISSGNSDSFKLCTVYDMSYLELKLNVDELKILNLAEGQTVTLTADAAPGDTYSGVITSVLVAGTTTNGTTTYPVTVRIDDVGRLRPGMNASAVVTTASVTDALSVPSIALLRDSYILVTKDSPSAANAVTYMDAPDGYVYVQVETGVSDDNYIQITSGLQDGDVIAYDPAAADLGSYDSAYDGEYYTLT